MLKLSKKTEYALMAARHLALNNSGRYSTAKEIAENYQISLQLVAKVLQNLAKQDIAISFQGARGGYKLSKPPDKITLNEIINAVESKRYLTLCMIDNECSHIDCCQIRDPLIGINKKIENIFEQTFLSNIL